MPEPLFDVFISAARDDAGYVRELARQLTARGVSTWYDREQPRIGGGFANEIQEALERSRFMVMVLSPSYFSDSWTNFEMGVAIVSYSRAGRVLPIYLREVQGSKVPTSIRRLTGFRAKDLTLDDIASRIVEVVENDKKAA